MLKHRLDQVATSYLLSIYAIPPYESHENIEKELNNRPAAELISAFDKKSWSDGVNFTDAHAKGIVRFLEKRLTLKSINDADRDKIQNFLIGIPKEKQRKDAAAGDTTKDPVFGVQS